MLLIYPLLIIKNSHQKIFYWNICPAVNYSYGNVFLYLWPKSLKTVFDLFIFSRAANVHPDAFLKPTPFAGVPQGLLYSWWFHWVLNWPLLINLVVIRSSHGELFYKKAYPAIGCPTAHLLCTCVQFFKDHVWGFSFIRNAN